MSDSVEQQLPAPISETHWPDMDWRIRLTGKAYGTTYRIVAPEGKTYQGRFHNKGPLVIEREEKDAMGNTKWAHVGSFTDEIGISDDSMMGILYYLINGGIQ